MGSAYALIAVVVVLLIVGAVMLSRLGRERAVRHEQVATARHTLRYDVPAGQDPSAVLVALSRGGFEATSDPTNSHAVTIVLPLGSQQREEVRVLIENEAGQTLDPQDDVVPGGPVRFADER